MSNTGRQPLRSDNAWNLFKRGKWAAAQAEFEALLAETPDSPELNTRLGRVLTTRKYPQAEVYLRRGLALDPTATEAMIALAAFFASVRRWDEAVQTYEAALDADPNAIWALLGLAEIHIRRKRHSEGYALFTRALDAAPKNPAVAERYSRALLGHSLRMAGRALELDPNSTRAMATLASAARALTPVRLVQERAANESEAGDPDAPATVRAPTGQAPADRPPQRSRPAIWPRLARQFDDLESVVREYVLTGCKPPRPILGPDSKVVTLGSCFAEYIANSLRQRNVEVFFQKRSESIDNLCANRHFLDWIAADDAAGGNPNFQSAEERDAYSERFRVSNVFILSLGVAAAYFDRETGVFVQPHANDRATLASSREFRMLSVEENAAHLRAIIARVRELNPGVQIVLTVSPIPMAATFDRPSAVLADTVSKSTLRMAVEAVLSDRLAGVYYWPSFEIVRWLGAHLPTGHAPVFGGDDGASRHVSMWLVNMIIRLFLEYFGDELSQANDPETHVPVTA